MKLPDWIQRTLAAAARRAGEEELHLMYQAALVLTPEEREAIRDFLQQHMGETPAQQGDALAALADEEGLPIAEALQHFCAEIQRIKEMRL